MIVNILFVMLLTLAYSFPEQERTPISFDDRVKFLIWSEHPDSLQRAMSLVDSAMAVDTVEYGLFVYKVRILWILGQRESALVVLDTAIRRVPEYLAHALVTQGTILDYLGRIPEAKEKYEQCRSLAEQAILDNPKDIHSRVARAWYLTFLGRKQHAIDEMRMLLDENPSDKYIKNVLDEIRNYERFEFLRRYTP